MEGRLKADIEALAAMTRGSASPGEHASGEWIAGRLREVGARDVALEPYRFQPSYVGAHLAHVGAALLAARLGGVRGAVLVAAALASFEAEVSGRFQWVRRLLPAAAGVNVLARVPAAGERRATLVLVAHHDAARTGLAWHPALLGLGAAGARRRRVMTPRAGPIGVGMALAAAPWRPLRRTGAAVLWAAAASLADIATSPTVPGANDNASGVAALLALAARFAAEPPEHVEVSFVFPGCEESGMGGMAAWLRAHRSELDPATVFVLGLDTIGSGEPIVCTGEATLFANPYDAADLDLVDAGAARAGVAPPARWRVSAWTDPILARHAGLRAASILSVGPDGLYANWHRLSDTPERVDLACAERCVRIAAGVAAELDVAAVP